jgi:type I restriction enzyme R subunit
VLGALEREAESAADQINLDEAATRTIIDEQLRSVGWEADTLLLRYAAGARPIKGRNRAVAGFPRMSTV